MPPRFNPDVFTFPDNLVLDLHDLAGILLHERALTEPRFKYAQLLEVRRGSELAESLPPATQEIWTNIPGPDKVAYFLGSPANQLSNPITPETFLSPAYKASASGALSAQELEMIYWRVKHHDSGYKMAHAMQLVLDSLPESTKVQIRTAKGCSAVFDASSFFIGGNALVVPKTSMYVCNMTAQRGSTTRVGISQYILDSDPIPYIYLSFGDPLLAAGRRGTDPDVFVLDLVSAMLGVRGHGGEVFILEKADAHHQKLWSACTAIEPESSFLRIQTADENNKKEPEELAMRVLGRLQAICAGEGDFCRYCGKAKDAQQLSQCAGCKKARYCNKDCQKAAWKYHKAWCREDGVDLL